MTDMHLMGSLCAMQVKQDVYTRNIFPIPSKNTRTSTRDWLLFLSRVARQFLNQRFANKWIGRGGPIAWPARSLDLNPLDFHLWGHLKSIVYAASIEHAEIPRNRIEQGFRQIRETSGMTERVTRSMTRRVQACLQMKGGHFERLL